MVWRCCCPTVTRRGKAWIQPVAPGSPAGAESESSTPTVPAESVVGYPKAKETVTSTGSSPGL